MTTSEIRSESVLICFILCAGPIIQHTVQNQIPNKLLRRGKTHPRNKSKGQMMGPTPSNAYSKIPIITTIQEGSPQALRTALRYVQQTSCTNAAGEVGSQVFFVNSLFAPGASTTVGTKHQPKLFDQWTPLFNEYIVTRCRITATVCPTGAVSSACGFLGLTLSDTSGIAFTGVEDMLEDDKTSFKAFGGLGCGAVTATKVWNLSSEVLAGFDPRSAISGVYGASVTASPTDAWYCGVSIGTAVDGAVLSTVQVLVELDMECMFLSRRNVAQS